VPTFREAANTVFEANKPRWRSEQHTQNWLKYLERHAMPQIGDMPVDRVRAAYPDTALGDTHGNGSARSAACPRRLAMGAGAWLCHGEYRRGRD